MLGEPASPELGGGVPGGGVHAGGGVPGGVGGGGVNEPGGGVDGGKKGFPQSGGAGGNRDTGGGVIGDATEPQQTAPGAAVPPQYDGGTVVTICPVTGEHVPDGDHE